MILTLTEIEILQNELECWGANGAPAWWTWDPEDCGDSSRGQGPKVRLSKLLPSCQVDSVNEIHGVDLMQSDLKVLSISSNRLRNLGSVWSSAGTQIWFKFNVHFLLFSNTSSHKVLECLTLQEVNLAANKPETKETKAVNRCQLFLLMFVSFCTRIVRALLETSTAALHMFKRNSSRDYHGTKNNTTATLVQARKEWVRKRQTR